jgi:hypothetical protein
MMKAILRGGLVGITGYLLVQLAFRLLAAGSVERLLNFLQGFGLQAWISEGSIAVGAFVAGGNGAALNVPRKLLLLGLCLVPCSMWALVLLHMDALSAPAYLYWVNPICSTAIAIFPSLVYLGVRRTATETNRTDAKFRDG